VTVRGTAGGDQATLTPDIAAVRVGDDAITVTAGGLDGGESDSLEQAVKLGTQRLKDVLAGTSPAASPDQRQPYGRRFSPDRRPRQSRPLCRFPGQRDHRSGTMAPVTVRSFV
jgi:hypothetical protein